MICWTMLTETFEMSYTKQQLGWVHQTKDLSFCDVFISKHYYTDFYVTQVNSQLHSKETYITNVIILPRQLEDDIEINPTRKMVKRNIVNNVFQRYIKPGYSLRWKALEFT